MKQIEEPLKQQLGDKWEYLQGLVTIFTLSVVYIYYLVLSV